MTGFPTKVDLIEEEEEKEEEEKKEASPVTALDHLLRFGVVPGHHRRPLLPWDRLNAVYQFHYVVHCVLCDQNKNSSSSNVQM